MINKFKYILREFLDTGLPDTIEREFILPYVDQIISVFGSRRSGKTYLFYSHIKKLIDRGIKPDQILYINFEDDRIYPLKLKDMQYLLDAYYELYPENIDEQKYFFFDEIQNVENWEIFVRRILDKERVKIFITGSSAKLHSSEIATALGGRTIAFAFYPLNFREYLDFNQIVLDNHFEFSRQRFEIKKYLDTYINEGGFPELVDTRQIKLKLLNSYYQSIIFKDLVERYSIRNITLLRDLVQYLMTNIANLFSLNKYYKSIQSSGLGHLNTIADYFSHLLNINLIYQVKYYSYSLKSQQSRPVKIYSLDTGLRNAIAFKFSKDIGRLVENTVFLHLIRKYNEIFYWKDNKSEVDFVFRDENDQLIAINVTYGDTIPEREIQGLISFKKNKSADRLYLISKNHEKNESGINFIPLWLWLLKF